VTRFVLEAPAIYSANRATQARARRDVESSIAVFQNLITVFPSDQLRAITDAVGVVMGADEERADEASARMLAGGEALSRAERTALELEGLAESFRLRNALLADALTAPQVAKMLGVSRQTPHDRTSAGTLLGVLDHGVLRFPPWQFDPSGPDGVVAGFPEIVRALSMSAMAKINWFTRPNPYLEGRRPIDALQAEPARVLETARGTGGR
jgi:hypothetical protein